MKTTLTIEESSRLIELGVDKCLANIVSANEPYYSDDVEFSLGALLSILPKKITDRRNIYRLQIGVTGLEEIWYVRYIGGQYDSDELDTRQESDNLINAVYYMLCYLKENKIQEL